MHRRRLNSGTCEGTKSSVREHAANAPRPKASWQRPRHQKRRLHHDILASRRQQDQISGLGLRQGERRPECSQADSPGRGGLLLSQQLGHLVLFLQRMPHELSWRRSMPPSPRRRTASRQARRAPWPSGGGRGVATAPLHESPGARQSSSARWQVTWETPYTTPIGRAGRIHQVLAALGLLMNGGSLFGGR